MDGNSGDGAYIDALLKHFTLGYAPAAPAAPVAAPDALAAQLEALREKMEQAISKALNTVLETLGSRLTRVELSAETLQVRVTALEADNKELHRSLNYFDGQVTDLQAQVSGMKAKQDADAAAAADEPELQRRKPNLKLTHLPETTSQASAEKVVPELLYTLGITIAPTKVSYRPAKSYAAAATAATTSEVGPTSPPRGFVVVEFAADQVKEDCFKAAGRLQGTKFERTHLDHDLTQRQQEEKRRLQPTFQRLWEEKKKPRWRGSQILVAGKPYTAEGPPSRSTPSRSTPAQPLTSNITNTTPFSALSPSVGA